MPEGYRWIKAQISDEDYEAARKDKGDLTWDDYVRLKLTSSWVYVFERADRAVKIGFSGNPSRRVQNLQREFGPLSLLAARPGGRKEEKEAHKRLADSRIGRTEWFVRSPEVDAFIAESVELFGRYAIDDWADPAVSIRLTTEENEIFERAMAVANEELRKQGLPGNLTRTSLTRHLLLQWAQRPFPPSPPVEAVPAIAPPPEPPEDDDDRQPTREVRDGAPLWAALAALRGAKG